MTRNVIINKLFLITFTFMSFFLFLTTTQAKNVCKVCNGEYFWIDETKKTNCTVIDDVNINNKAECIALSKETNNCGYITPELHSLLQDIFDLLKFADVILVLGLTIISFVQAVAKGGDELKKAATITGKRLIIGVIIFFVPNLINFFFGILGLYGTCGIG